MICNKSKKINQEAGLTLSEMLVAMAGFSIILINIMSIFVSSARTQQKTLDLQNIQDEVRYVLDYMAREIRMADRGGKCGIASNNIYKTSKNNLEFLKSDTSGNIECVKYFLKNDNIEKNGIALNSENIAVKELKFTQAHTNIQTGQPRITILLKVQPAESNNDQNTIYVQTTISSRAR